MKRLLTDKNLDVKIHVRARITAHWSQSKGDDESSVGKI